MSKSDSVMLTLRMIAKWFLVFCCGIAGLCLADTHRKLTKCYQCAYSPDRVEYKVIKVPHVTKQLVKVPRIAVRYVKVPRIVQQQVQVPKIEKEVFQVPRMVKVPRTVKKKVYGYDYYGFPRHTYRTHQVFEKKTLYEPKEVTKKKFEFVTKTKKIYDVRRKTFKVFDNTYKTKTTFITKSVTVKKYGGWDKCLGPFSKHQAQRWGIDVWDCDSNCYTRLDYNGNLHRGCYKGEYKVNPNKLGCSHQAGATYCFCKGDLCNVDVAATRSPPAADGEPPGSNRKHPTTSAKRPSGPGNSLSYSEGRPSSSARRPSSSGQRLPYSERRPSSSEGRPSKHKISQFTDSRPHEFDWRPFSTDLRHNKNSNRKPLTTRSYY